MGKQSNLGPIDPQLKGVPAYGVIHEFERAHEAIKKDPSALAVWQFILNKYHPTFLSECENALELAKDLVRNNLTKVMFKGDKKARAKANKVVNYLSDYKERKAHARHINIDECQTIGLKVKLMEDEQKLQDAILTVHHCYMHTLANTVAFKLIENQNGAAYIRKCVSPV